MTCRRLHRKYTTGLRFEPSSLSPDFVLLIASTGYLSVRGYTPRNRTKVPPNAQRRSKRSCVALRSCLNHSEPCIPHLPERRESVLRGTPFLSSVGPPRRSLNLRLVLTSRGQVLAVPPTGVGRRASRCSPRASPLSAVSWPVCPVHSELPLSLPGPDVLPGPSSSRPCSENPAALELGDLGQVSSPF